MANHSKKQHEKAEEAAILTAIKCGEKAADEGRVVSHAEVKKRFMEWTKKR